MENCLSCTWINSVKRLGMLVSAKALERVDHVAINEIIIRCLTNKDAKTSADGKKREQGHVQIDSVGGGNEL